MSDQLPSQIYQSPNQPFLSRIKRKHIVLAVIALILLTSFYITYGKSNLPLDNLITSCQPKIERTPNRKTGVVAIENGDGSFTNVTLYQSGENNLLKGYSVIDATTHLNLQGLSLRGGKVINIDEKNKILTINVGDGNKMTIQTTKDQIIKIKKVKSLYGKPTSESFINDAKFCHIQEGDVIGLLLDKSTLKTYDKVLIVPAMEIAQ